MSKVIFEKTDATLIGRLLLPDGRTIAAGVRLPLKDSISEDEAKSLLTDAILKRREAEEINQPTLNQKEKPWTLAN